MRHLLCGMLLIILCAACLSQPDPAPARRRLGINLSGAADWNTEIAFTNIFHFSRR